MPMSYLNTNTGTCLAWRGYILISNSGPLDGKNYEMYINNIFWNNLLLLLTPSLSLSRT